MSQQLAEPLKNITVLVTRPAQQNQTFIQQLLDNGARAVAFPTIEIQPADDMAAAEARISILEQYDLLIFISTNAVEYGLKVIENQGKSINQPVSAIGKSTSLALEKHHIEVSLLPESGFNSEALLALDELQSKNISGKRLLIFRGQGGRELLANTLKARGAIVDYAEVYRRSRPPADNRVVIELWRQRQIHIATVTSNESLKNLYDICGENGREFLCQTPLVVPSKRCAELARQLGFNTILLASSASNEAMLDRIILWHDKTGRID